VLAAEIHLNPLARGIVDASDTAASTLTVMGQTVQLTAATNFVDHRACLTGTTSPCSAITGQSALSNTTGSGGTAVAGSYVTVHGYLFDSGTSSGGANIVATLVSIGDAPTTASGANYKAEGVVTAVAGSTLTIGGLSVDLSAATCYAAGTMTPCASGFSTGQVVAVIAATGPSLPATSLAGTLARLHSKLAVETVGASVEVEGKVSAVTTSPASFVLRGVTVDATALPPATALPAVGDEVRVLGTLASGGTTITASALTVLHVARSASYGFEGDAAGVTAGSTADTYVLTLLGQSIAVNAGTRLADRSVRGNGRGDSPSNPFNITTFQAYLAASASQHLLVRSAADASGNLNALSVTIVPASSAAAIGGTVDVAPAPVNSTTSGTPSTFSVHGLTVSADPAAIVKLRTVRNATPTTVAAGDFVLVRGTYASGTLSVAAPSGAVSPFANNVVIDLGAPTGKDHDCF
jgi:hypothetical protein